MVGEPVVDAGNAVLSVVLKTTTPDAPAYPGFPPFPVLAVLGPKP